MILETFGNLPNFIPLCCYGTHSPTSVLFRVRAYMNHGPNLFKHPIVEMVGFLCRCRVLDLLTQIPQAREISAHSFSVHGRPRPIFFFSSSTTELFLEFWSLLWNDFDYCLQLNKHTTKMAVLTISSSFKVCSQIWQNFKWILSKVTVECNEQQYILCNQNFKFKV